MKNLREEKNGRFTQIAKKTRVNLYDSFVVVWWIVVSLEGDNCSQFCDISQVFVPPTSFSLLFSQLNHNKLDFFSKMKISA